MDPAYWKRLREIFNTASELYGAERERYLDSACAGDKDFRRDVDALLAEHDSPDGDSQLRLGPDGPEPKAETPPTFATADMVADRFKIGRLIGRGGMGEVYEAYDVQLGERVALKTLRAEFVGDKTSVARFQREIRMARRVSHANVCRVHEFGQHRDDAGGIVSFLTMELLDGEPLSDFLARQRRVPPSLVGPVLKQMLAGLVALHNAGVVHRDLKPANVILVGSGGEHPRAVLTDFGLARGTGSASSGISLTQSDQLLGTPMYMAPEQLDGGNVAEPADLYAVGLIVYEMLTGARAFDGNNAVDISYKKLHNDGPDDHESFRAAPENWRLLTLACLRRDPKKRLTAREVATALKDVEPIAPVPAASGLAGSGDGQAVTVEPGRAWWRLAWLHRSGMWRYAAAAVCFALLALALVLAQPERREGARTWLCGFPALWPSACPVPNEKHVTVVPFEIVASDEDSRVLAAGFELAANRVLAQFVPLDSSLCLHRRDDGKLYGLRLLLEGAIRWAPEGVELSIDLVEHRVGVAPRVARRWKRSIAPTDARTLQTGVVEGLHSLLDVQGDVETLPESIYPGTADAAAYLAYLRGLSRLAEGMPDEAHAAFRDAVDAEYGFALGHLGAGDSWRAKLSGSSAENVATQARDSYRHAGNFDAALDLVPAGLGLLEQSLSNHSEARGNFENALTLNVRNFDVHRRLAATLDALELGAESEDVMGHLVEEFPVCWEVQNRLGIYWGHRGDYEKSEDYFDKVVQLAPDNPMAFNNLASTLIRRGRYAEAVVHARKSVALEPRGAAYRTLGSALLGQGDCQEAIEVLEQAVEADPDDYKGRSYLEEAYGCVEGKDAERAEQSEEIIKLTERAVAADPADFRPRIVLALSLARSRSLRRAVEEIGVALDLASKNPEVLHHSALVYALAGEEERALASIEASVLNGHPFEPVLSAPEFERLRATQGFEELVARIGR